MLTNCFLLLSDINECSYNRGGCEQLCINFPGSYNCSCLEGYTLQNDKTTCKGTLMVKNIINLTSVLHSDFLLGCHNSFKLLLPYVRTFM